MRNLRLGKHNRMATSALLACAMLAGFATGSFAIGQYIVSQKGREFTPKELTISRGESMTIVNDDADLRHHVYIASDNFNFDSGDQEPGSKTNVAFPVAGTFDVLCAIHPKMRLVVQVK
jgi:plastocyanin